MVKRSHDRPLWLLVAAGLVLGASVPADAQIRPRHPAAARSDDRAVYDHAYRLGLSHGERDGRDGRAHNYRSREYDRALDGYRSAWGDREAYRRVFRTAYIAGYEDGYRRHAQVRRAPRYPSYPGRYGRYGSPAFDRGFEEGYREGLDAGRDNDRFDPRREKRYRQGDRGYNKRYGSREAYKAEYRHGFLAGYERGYREGRRDRYYDRRRGGWW